MAINRNLSELEGCVLGIVWAAGPCTAYSIRKVFLESPTPYWSGSAGAIYPLVERLERHGLLRSSEQMTGRKASRPYMLTSAGRKRLVDWLKPLPDIVIGVPPDPLRTRMEFLNALPRKEQLKFIDEAKNKLTAHLNEVQQDCKEKHSAGDRFSYLALRGTVRMILARIAWLDEIRRELGKRAGRKEQP